MGIFFRSFIIIIIFSLFFFCFNGAVSEKSKGRPSLEAYKLWSRKEMVEMAGYGEEKLSSVFVTGSLLCHTCSPPHPSSPSSPLPGVSVAIKCATRDKRRPGWIKTVTDEYGEFVFDLPSHLHAIPNLEKTCLVKILHLPKGSKCYSVSAKKQRGLKLVSTGNGIRVYTAGSIRFHQFTPRSLEAGIAQSSV